jgi:osmoprotectant transport system permease protein
LEILSKAFYYVSDHSDLLWDAIQVHLLLSATAIGIGILICVPLGIFISRLHKGSTIVLNTIYMGRIVPSLAALAIMMPYVGIGFKPSLIVLTLLVCPPILINTYTAFKEVDKSIIEAAYGMGMNKTRVIRRVEFPLALPVIITGIRTASVECISTATLAAFIGAGGLGEFILNGIGLADSSLLLVGAVPVAVLALLAEIVLGRVEKWARPRGV